LSTALIAGGAAILGGLLSAFATRSVERMRLEHALQEKTDERKLASVLRFTNAAFAWFDWLRLMEDQGMNDEVLDEYNLRSRERQHSYRELQLLCSDDLFHWLRVEYDPLEYRVRAEIGEPVRWGRQPAPETADLRREYLEMLYKTLIDRFRPEIRTLQVPFSGRLASPFAARRLGAHFETNPDIHNEKPRDDP
jgi:hypothetical protein